MRAIVRLGSKAEVLKAFQDANRTLPINIVNGMTSIEQEEKVIDWSLIRLFCKVCGYEFCTIVPSIACVDNEQFECAACHYRRAIINEAKYEL